MIKGIHSLVLFALMAPLVLGCHHLKPRVTSGLYSRLAAVPQCNGVTSHQAIVEYELVGGSAETQVDIHLRSADGEDLTFPLAQRGPNGRIAIPLDHRAGGDLDLSVSAFDPANDSRKHSSCSTKLVPCRRARNTTETLVVAAVLPLSGADQTVGRCLEQELRQAAAAAGRTDVVVYDSGTSRLQTGAVAKLSRHGNIDAVVVYAKPGTISRQAIELITSRGLPVFAIGSAPGGGATEVPLQQQDGCQKAAYQAISVAALGNRGFTETPEGDFGIVLPPLPRDTCTWEGMFGDVEVLRPAVTSVEPATLPLGSAATVAVHGKFETSAVGIDLVKEDRSISIGRLPVERESSSSEVVRFKIPAEVTTGDYGVVARHSFNCVSGQDVRLNIERQKNTEWFVMTLARVLAEDDEDDNAHGEARFVLGGQSKEAAKERRTTVAFPAGPYIAVKEPRMFVVDPDYLDDDDEKQQARLSTVQMDVPFVWEPVAQLGTEIGYSIGAVEDDPETGSEWAKPLLIAIGAAIGCYAGEGVGGCVTGYCSVSEIAIQIENAWLPAPSRSFSESQHLQLSRCIAWERGFGQQDRR